MKGLPDKSVDMICCDPPFQKTHAKWDKMLDLNKMWWQFNRVIKDNGVMLLFCQGDFTAELIMSNRKFFRYDLVYQKTHAVGFLNSHSQPLRDHEQILAFSKKRTVYNPQKQDGFPRKVVKKESRKSVDVELWNKHLHYRDYDSTERHPRSVLKFKSERQKEAYHPCQKPLSLIDFLILSYTNAGDLVLDPTAGSGTVAISCIKNNRNYINIEKEDKYYQIIKNRIEKFEAEKK